MLSVVGSGSEGTGGKPVDMDDEKREVHKVCVSTTIL